MMKWVQMNYGPETEEEARARRKRVEKAREWGGLHAVDPREAESDG